MVQEIVNNSLKHSGASEITIQVDYDKKRFTLSVSDNGKGFNPQEKMEDLSDTGNGLLNLRQRAKVINAAISFNSAPGKGTETIISMAL